MRDKCERQTVFVHNERKKDCALEIDLKKLQLFFVPVKEMVKERETVCVREIKKIFQIKSIFCVKERER